MSTWNYRIVKYLDGTGFGLHEVHYREDGSPRSMSMRPCGFRARADQGVETIRASLRLALLDASERPVLDEPTDWGK